MKAKIRVWIEDGDRHIIGSGIANLLSYIDELGSIRAAASRMKMSYRRAWGAIQNLEQNLEFNVIERSIGGAKGGGSALTKEGQALLCQYQVLQRSVKSFSEKKFKELFSDTGLIPSPILQISYVPPILSRETHEEETTP